MRPWQRRTQVLPVLALGLGVSIGAHADFNPEGRGKGKKAHSAEAGARPRNPSAARVPAIPKASGGASAALRSPAPASEDGEKTDALIARYTALVLARPGEPFPLERLIELHRGRDGNVDKLLLDLRARLDRGGPEHYAALVALAGTLQKDARNDEAVSAYERAIAEAPQNPVAMVALGRVLEASGDKAGARKSLDAARPFVVVDADREQLLRTLLGLSLDLKDFDGAKSYHDELVKRAKGSFFARAELGRELMDRGDFARAEAEYRDVVKAAAGDNRALAPALRDLGRALAREGKSADALSTLERALTTAGSQSGLRREILDVMVDVHRTTGGVAELVTLLEKERPDDFERLTLLANLYEETGRVGDALTTYQKALGRKDDIATRLKVVQLLEVAGKLDDAVKEYDKLVRAAPHDPELVFRLAQMLIERGDRKEALVAVGKLEARSRGDEETLTALVDFYERVGEPDRAEKILDRLAAAGGSDPRHLVELGDHYFRKGDTKRALEIWDRIRGVVGDRARGLLALGEVLLEHDMPDPALTALRQAVELSPHEPRYQKAYALALERTGTSATGVHRAEPHEAARRIWEGLLQSAGKDRAAAREARQHIVTLWGMDGHLSDRVRPLERRLAKVPPDLDAGRLLAEVYARLRRPADTERVLRLVVAAAPGDEEAFLGLERALVTQRKLAQAIVTLEKLVSVDARRAREYYERMAGYAAELYRDDDAIRYASKAVELNPDDAEGHRKLGEMYRRHQDVPHAVLELRRALAKNDRLFPVYFDLAELLLTQGDVEEADRLLRHVVRAAPDDDLVMRAARLSMQVNIGRGTLESLERELLPIALGNPMRPLYRRLLVEVYDSLAFPLIHDAKGGDAARAATAREALRRIGERAVKPLLDALGDDRQSQQRTAVELLSRISNPSAAPALVAFATGKADGDLRTRAMIAVGALGDPSTLPRLRAVLAPSGDVRVDETDTVAVAAAWGVARLKTPRARPLLTEMLASDAPSIRALGAVGLGLSRVRGDTRALAQISASPEEEPVVRAAAVFALGALGGADSRETLSGLADAPDPVLRGAAVLALARLRADGAKRVIAAALVSPDADLRDTGARAALVYTTHEYRMPADPLPIPDGRVDVRAVVSGLVPTGFSADERAQATVAIEAEVTDAAVTAVHTGPEGARVVADALLGHGAPGTEATDDDAAVSVGVHPSFSPLTDGIAEASADARAASDASLERIARALTGPFLALARHPSAEVRARAIRVLATRPEPEARAAVVAALEDPDGGVQRAALFLLGATKDPSAVAAVTKLAQSSRSWPVRERATEALGALARASDGGAAAAVLATIASEDAMAFVREAAMRALASAHGPSDVATRRTLQGIASRDPEPRLRTLAKTLLEGVR